MPLRQHPKPGFNQRELSGSRHCVGFIGQTCASVLQQVKDQLESLGSVIVGVRDIVVAHGLADKCRHRHYLVLVLKGRSYLPQVADIIVVHTHYEVEIIEIAHAHTTRYVGQFHTAAACVHYHTLVRALAVIVSARAGRVYHPVGSLSAAFHYVTQYPLGRSGAADVSEAHKQSPSWMTSGQMLLYFCDGGGAIHIYSLGYKLLAVFGRIYHGVVATSLARHDIAEL